MDHGYTNFQTLILSLEGAVWRLLPLESPGAWAFALAPLVHPVIKDQHG